MCDRLFGFAVALAKGELVTVQVDLTGGIAGAVLVHAVAGHVLSCRMHPRVLVVTVALAGWGSVCVLVRLVLRDDFVAVIVSAVAAFRRSGPDRCRSLVAIALAARAPVVVGVGLIDGHYTVAVVVLPVASLVGLGKHERVVGRAVFRVGPTVPVAVSFGRRLFRRRDRARALGFVCRTPGEQVHRRQDKEDCRCLSVSRPSHACCSWGAA